MLSGGDVHLDQAAGMEALDQQHHYLLPSMPASSVMGWDSSLLSLSSLSFLMFKKKRQLPGQDPRSVMQDLVLQLLLLESLSFLCLKVRAKILLRGVRLHLLANSIIFIKSSQTLQRRVQGGLNPCHQAEHGNMVPQSRDLSLVLSAELKTTVSSVDILSCHTTLVSMSQVRASSKSKPSSERSKNIVGFSEFHHQQKQCFIQKLCVTILKDACVAQFLCYDNQNDFLKSEGSNIDEHFFC